MIRELDDKAKRRLLTQSRRSASATVKSHESSFKERQEDMLLLENCINDYNSGRIEREDRERNFRYKRGDQWGDLVPDPDSPHSMIREDRLISRQGRSVSTHNIVQQLFRNIEGQMLTNPSQTVVHARSDDDRNLSDMLTNTVQAAHQLNDVKTLDLNMLEELLSAGFGAVKVTYGYWSEKNRFDVKISLVNINRLFFSRDIEDPRLTDIRRIGEIHDYTYDELMSNFAKNKTDETFLKEHFGALRESYEYGQRSSDYLKSMDILGDTVSLNKYRVIEVWEKVGRWVLYWHDYLEGEEGIYTDVSASEAAVRNINAERVAIASAAGIPEEDVNIIYTEQRYEYYWLVKFLTPTGVCIKETESPYRHESHPYVLCAMPVVDGHFQPVMSDLRDIQRYINRLISMIDFMIMQSMKGVTFIPQSMITAGVTKEEVASAIKKGNGVVVYDDSNPANGKPFQLSNNVTNIGVWEMLQMEMNLMYQISGLSGAAQGQVARSNTPASLYAQEAQNSSLNYSIVFDRLSAFQQKRDEKLLKVIMQYYDTRRYVNINGRAYTDEAKFYEPELAREIVDFNLVTSKSNDTPVFRQMSDQLLTELQMRGAIPLEVYLNNISMPNAQKILSDIRSYQEQLQQGQPVGPDQQALLQQIGQNADPQAVAMMQQLAQSDVPLSFMQDGQPVR